MIDNGVKLAFRKTILKYVNAKFYSLRTDERINNMLITNFSVKIQNIY